MEGIKQITIDPKSMVWFNMNGTTTLPSDVYSRMEAVIAAARSSNFRLIKIALEHLDEKEG